MDDLTRGSSVAALTAIPGIGAQRATTLARHLRTWADLRRASHATLAALTTDTLAHRIREHLPTLPEGVHLPSGTRVVSILEPSYPAALATIPNAPPLLWVRGTLPPEDCAAVVGTRNPTGFGLAATRTITAHLTAAGYGIVSGLARGVDETAHRGALHAGKPNWAILGCGVDILPAGDRGLLARAILNAGGGLLSEVPPGVPVQPRLLMARNRIQSGLSRATVITQTGLANAASGNPAGTMHTARHTIEQNRLLVVTAPPKDQWDDPALAGNLALTSPHGCDPGLLHATGDLAARIAIRHPVADVTVRHGEDLPALVQAIKAAQRPVAVSSSLEATLF